MSFRRINDQLVIDGTNNITASINIIRQLQADIIRKDAEIDRLRKQLAAVGIEPPIIKHEQIISSNNSQQQQQIDEENSHQQIINENLTMSGDDQENEGREQGQH